MVDLVEIIRFFTEFIPSVPSGQALSQKPRPFAALRVTRRRVQNDNHSIRAIAVQAPKGEGICREISNIFV
jgi:hypothetical protein